MKKLYRAWRRKRRGMSDTLWSTAVRGCRYAGALPEDDRYRLRKLTEDFIKIKSFEGAAGLEVNDNMRLRIALHACLPILNIGLESYADWVSIVIYPGDFRVQDEYMDEHGIVHREIADLCGQSLTQGPIVLSWDTIMKEDDSPSDHDLVIHECAHKLDISNGAANGYPPLPADMSASDWARDFHAAYERLCDDLDAGRDTRLDSYAADDPSEFFAVISEFFFTAPKLVYEDFPAVYSQLTHYYRQDTLRAMQGMKP